MEKLRIGVIGASSRGGELSMHWDNEKQKRSVITAVADNSDNALKWFRENITDKAFETNDYRDILKRDDVDAVAVMSPDYTHEQIVCEAFEAGKHVFTEKPLAITTEGCDRMLKAWVDSGKKMMVGFNMRYMNIFRVMKDVIDSGVIGEVKNVWVRHFVGRGGEWYFHDWHANSKNSTGLLLQKASHDIDMIHWLTGKYTVKTSASGGLDYYGGDRPNDVDCTECPDKNTCVEFQGFRNPGNNTAKCVFRKEVDVEDNSTVMMLLDGGIKATYMQCHYTPDYFRNYTIIGTEGRIENRDDSGKVIVKLRKQSKRWKNLASDYEIKVREVEGSHGGADAVIAEDFLDMLLENKDPIATPLAGRMSVAVGCAATESIRDGWKVVDITQLPDELKNKVF